MLVLSRKKDKAVVIKAGEITIEVLVVEILGDKVRIGFSAPNEVAIHREEVWLAIERNKADGK